MNLAIQSFIILLFLLFQETGQGTNGDKVMRVSRVTSPPLDSAWLVRYPFIRADTNLLETVGESPVFRKFMQRFDSMVHQPSGNLNIYHFGGSHIQADVYSNRIRRYLQQYAPGMEGSRGWVFPYSMAGTNNPTNYKVNFTGRWKGIRSPVKKDSMKTLGLMGISATALDSVSTLKMYSNEVNPPFQASYIRVYFNAGETSGSVKWNDTSVTPQTFLDLSGGFMEFRFDVPMDTVQLVFERTAADTAHPFTLYGILLLNDRSGINYHSIGVNGAGFNSYFRCQQLEAQLRQLPPDLAVISIGTNDANDTGFTPKEYADNYIRFVELLRRANPGCALLFTVPNDNYYKYRYPQKNIARCEAVIFGLAEKYDAAVWDFYRIMGGLGSSQKWYRSHLMQRDRIHFTREGYEIKGDLFTDAFRNYYLDFKRPDAGN